MDPTQAVAVPVGGWVAGRRGLRDANERFYQSTMIRKSSANGANCRTSASKWAGRSPDHARIFPIFARFTEMFDLHPARIQDLRSDRLPDEIRPVPRHEGRQGLPDRPA